MSRRKIRPLLVGSSLEDVRDNLLARSAQLQRAAAERSSWARMEHKRLGRTIFSLDFCIDCQNDAARLYDTSVQYRNAADALTD